MLGKTPAVFDVSVWAWFWPLSQGACLVLTHPGGEKDPSFLLDAIERSQGVSTVIALARMYASTRGEQVAIDFLTRQLRQRPSVRGLMSLIGATLHKSEGEARENLLILQDLTRKLIEGQAMYRCSRCGFGAKAHHWQCPSCKTWGSVRPIHGVAGE